MTRRIDDRDRESRDPGYDVYVHVEHEGEEDGEAPEVHVHVHGPDNYGHGSNLRYVDEERGVGLFEGLLGVIWAFLFGWWLGGSDNW